MRARTRRRVPKLTTIASVVAAFALWGCRLGGVLGLLIIGINLIIAVLGQSVDVGQQIARAMLTFVAIVLFSSLIGLLLGLVLKYCGVLPDGGKPSAEARNPNGQS
ncbi:MAG: hypothetical protein QM773_04800 [Hyphomonadaceae bacterium]